MEDNDDDEEEEEEGFITGTTCLGQNRLMLHDPFKSLFWKQELTGLVDGTLCGSLLPLM